MAKNNRLYLNPHVTGMKSIENKFYRKHVHPPSGYRKDIFIIQDGYIDLIFSVRKA